MFPWASAGTLAPLCIGVIGLLVFIYIEHAVAKNPMAPLRIFAKRTALSGYIGALFHGLIVWSLIYQMVIYVSSILSIFDLRQS